MNKSGAETVIETLSSEGVSRIYSVSGNQILSIYDATVGTSIEIVHTRHEASAVSMADAWGRMTGQPGVALVTAGPGHCNALSTMYVARMAEAPLVLLSGHCATSQIGKGAFQEIDQVALTRPVAKAAWLVDRPERIRNDVNTAMTPASERRPGQFT